MTLADKRIIETASYNEEPDVTDEEALEIVEAIHAGKLLFWVASPKPEFRTSNHHEVNVTHYRDPRSAQLRYAVETWLGGRKWTTDFSRGRGADDQAKEDQRMVGL